MTQKRRTMRLLNWYLIDGNADSEGMVTGERARQMPHSSALHPSTTRLLSHKERGRAEARPLFVHWIAA